MNKYMVLSLLMITVVNTVTRAVSEYSTMGAEGHKAINTANLTQADINIISTGLKSINANAAKYTVNAANKANIKAALIQISTIKSSVNDVNVTFQMIGTQIQNDQYASALGNCNALNGGLSNSIQKATDTTLKNSLTDAKNQLNIFGAVISALSKL